MTNLLDLTKSGIVILSHENDMMVLPSVNMLKVASERLRDIRIGVSPFKSFNGHPGAIKTIFVEYSGSDINLETELLHRWYKSLGFNVYGGKAYARYKVRTSIKKLFDKKMVPVVELVSSRGEVTIVGVFLRMIDAKAFMRDYYINKGLSLPIVFARNESTRRYYSGNV